MGHLGCTFALVYLLILGQELSFLPALCPNQFLPQSIAQWRMQEFLPLGILKTVDLFKYFLQPLHTQVVSAQI